jgi:hypothetical protein
VPFHLQVKSRKKHSDEDDRWQTNVAYAMFSVDDEVEAFTVRSKDDNRVERGRLLSTDESGGLLRAIEITLNREIVCKTGFPSCNVTVPVAVGGAGGASEAAVQVSEVVFRSGLAHSEVGYWAKPQAVRYDGLDDDENDGDQEYTIVVGPPSTGFGSAPSFAVPPARSSMTLLGTNRDNDNLRLSLSKCALCERKVTGTGERAACEIGCVVEFSYPDFPADAKVSLSCACRCRGAKKSAAVALFPPT